MDHDKRKIFIQIMGLSVGACLPTGRQVPYDDFRDFKEDTWLRVNGLRAN